MSQIPGIKGAHCIISDECRSNHGDIGAFNEAMRRLRDEYERCANNWTIGRGAKLHLVLSLERPTPAAGSEQ